MTIQEVQSVLNIIVEAVKSYDSKKNMSFGKAKEPPLPDYYPNYKYIVELADKIKPHAEVGYFPEKIFVERDLNQEPQELDWLKRNFRQTTLPVYTDYSSTVQRIFHDSNWNIEYGEVPEKYDFQNYIETGIKDYGSLENFIKFFVAQQKGVYANGCIAFKPKEIPTVEINDELVVDPKKLYEPIPVFYPEVQKVQYERDVYYMFETNEKSVVDYGGAKKKIGHIYELYDKTTIWRIVQVGKFIDYTFEITPYYVHNLGYTPVIEMGGRPVMMNGELIWQSEFSNVVDLLDTCLIDSGRLDISKHKVAFPYVVSVADYCDYVTPDGVSCNQGFIYKGSENERKCPTCQGSGEKSRITPFGKLLVNPDQWKMNETALKPSEAIHIVSPPTETLEFLRTEIDGGIYKAKKMLHIQSPDKSTNFDAENQTATGSDNNLKALYAFLKPISDRIFFIYEFAVNTIGRMRCGADYKEVTLSYPTSFDFRTEEDYIKQITDAKKAGMPPFFIHTLYRRFLQSMYYNEERTAIAFSLIEQADRLFPYSGTEADLKANKELKPETWELVLHENPIFFLQELVNENPKFLEQDFTVMKEALIQKAKDKAEILESNTEAEITANTLANISDAA